MWFILIYASTIILYGLYVFVDMEKGDTLKVYFNFTDLELALASLLFPILNTCLVLVLWSIKILHLIWDKIKYWEK